MTDLLFLFTEEEFKPQGGQVTCLGFHSKFLTRTRLCAPDTQSSPFCHLRGSPKSTSRERSFFGKTEEGKRAMTFYLNVKKPSLDVESPYEKQALEILFLVISFFFL